MGRKTYLRGITLALAAMHSLPARHHLADFFAGPNPADAWKGFGALGAIALLVLPQRIQARLATLVWKYRLIGVVIAVAHVVPALDHLPKLFAAFTFGDAWKGIGATIAILWFLAPRAVQLAFVRAPQRPVKLAALGVAAAVLLAACGPNGLGPSGTNDPDAAGGGSCQPCVIDTDCPSGSVCAQLGGDSYCAATCTQPSDCQSDQQCLSVSTVSGDQAQACVQTASTTCGLNASQGDGGTTPGQDGSGPPPTSFDGGVTSNIGANGGTESNLFFAIVGDTRPATEDDTAHYPTAIISKIFSDLASLKTVPPFVVSTGDYQFSNPYGSQASAQLQLYLGAKGSYTGIQFPAMGNHECTGGTSSNCGAGNTNGVTNNYSAFMSDMLAPIQKTKPYYAINVSAPNNAWTAKFVFIAANAWDSTQSSWFDSAMSQSTTYTFVVRHEPASANTAPGVTPSETIMAKHPYTLAIVGHSHEYYHSKYNSPKEVVIGNGGAPLATNQNYGYGIVAQRSDGSLTVDMLDYQTNLTVSSFHFAVNADGSPAAP